MSFQKRAGKRKKSDEPLSEIKDNVLVSKEKGKEKEKEYDSGKFKKRDDIEWRRREKLGLEIDFFSLPSEMVSSRQDWDMPWMKENFLKADDQFQNEISDSQSSSQDSLKPAPSPFGSLLQNGTSQQIVDALTSHLHQSLLWITKSSQDDPTAIQCLFRLYKEDPQLFSQFQEQCEKEDLFFSIQNVEGVIGKRDEYHYNLSKKETIGVAQFQSEETDKNTPNLLKSLSVKRHKQQEHWCLLKQTLVEKAQSILGFTNSKMIIDPVCGGKEKGGLFIPSKYDGHPGIFRYCLKTSSKNTQGQYYYRVFTEPLSFNDDGSEKVSIPFFFVRAYTENGNTYLIRIDNAEMSQLPFIIEEIEKKYTPNQSDSTHVISSKEGSVILNFTLKKETRNRSEIMNQIERDIQNNQFQLATFHVNESKILQAEYQNPENTFECLRKAGLEEYLLEKLNETFQDSMVDLIDEVELKNILNEEESKKSFEQLEEALWSLRIPSTPTPTPKKTENQKKNLLSPLMIDIDTDIEFSDFEDSPTNSLKSFSQPIIGSYNLDHGTACDESAKDQTSLSSANETKPADGSLLELRPPFAFRRSFSFPSGCPGLYAKKRKISEELEPTIPYTVNPSNYVNHITPETLDWIFKNFSTAIGHLKVKIIDCRFDYEYEGGHVKNSINISKFSQMKSFFQENLSSDETFLLIFYCEYSLHRSVCMYKYYRELDRVTVGIQSYPKLHFPNIFILEGGYRQFHCKYQNLCSSNNYVQMKDNKNHSHMMKQFEKEFSTALKAK